MSKPEPSNDFAARLSTARHDLRTPVGHIIGYAELIEEDMDAAALKDCGHDLMAIQNAGQRILALVDQFFGEAKASIDDIDFDDAMFQIRMQLNHIGGYAEILHEDIVAAGDDSILGDLDHITKAQRQVLDLLEGLYAKLTAETTAPTGKPKSAAVTADLAAGMTIAGIGGEILIVDDDASNRELLARRLARGGYRSVVVDSGRAALEALETQRFDLVLLDHMMPGLSGLETLELIKGNPRLRTIPVIMLSAADEGSLMIQCILNGAEDYVAKPFNPVLLIARINACLEKVRLRQNAARQIKVFISSPGDVIAERLIVKSVIGRLNDEFAGRALLVPILWEEEPLLASDTFQAQIHPPRETEIYIGIMWSRIGSPLPPSITRPDGSQYESGTVFEYEDALQGYQTRGKPEMLLYRKFGAPMVSLADKANVLELLDQIDRLHDYVARNLIGEDGTFSSAFHSFEAPAQFDAMVEMHLRKLV
ncbi:response regulator, partial [Actibacterium sp.]|uniref:response regulator n=1 Tax=Actibacterium sp. TaxID=1872125 RepID=UPI003566A87B